MKKLLPFCWLVLALAFVALSAGCMKDKVSRSYKIMRPVYADKSVVLDNVKSGSAKQLQNPGKLFIRGSYLFINEVNKGVHIFDNSNPTSPKAVSFIEIPGNVDVAVSGNYLYADMYTDMLTINIEDPLNVKLIDTAVGIFPERFYVNGWNAYDSKIIVDWIISDTTISDDSRGVWPGAECISCNYMIAPADASFGKGGYVPGLAGSMARFVVVNKYLYVVSQASLLAFDIANEANPVRKSENYIGRMIETIYPFGNSLFIGSAEGLYIYNIDDPASPSQKGSFAHARACDPVVSDGEYAFVTLRSGDACAGNADQLDVIDVSDLMNPHLVKTYPLSNPKGLGKDGDLLFVCDADEGIKVYDAKNVFQLKQVNQIKDLDAFDVIPWEGRLIVSASDGLHQYDYSDHTNIKLLSKIQTAVE